MEIFGDVDFKALVFGAAISAAFIILGKQYGDGFYLFSAIGLLYAGYAQKNIIYATVIGAMASTPLVILALQGYLGDFEATETSTMILSIIIIAVGALVGFVGGWAKRSRDKAKEEYEKQQKIGKNKKKNKKAEAQKTQENTKIVDKIFKK